MCFHQGYYALLTTRDKVKDVNKIGEIISDPISTKDGHKCIIFYFLMNGIAVNYLKFYLRVNNVYFQIWNRQGHQGKSWLKGAISLPKSNVEYYVKLLLIFSISILAVPSLKLRSCKN